MRLLPRLLPLAVAAAVLFAPPGLPAADSPRPNILFILVDDLGPGDLGVFYQNQRAATARPQEPWFATPHLDALAAQGARLTRHYCPAPVCAPSRASLLLGVHQGHANVRDNQFDKELEHNHTLATVLRQAGYATVAIGKWGLQGPGTAPNQPGHPLKRGFDEFYGMLAHLSGHYHYPRETAGTDNQGQPTGVHDGATDVTAGLAKCYTTDLWTARAKRWLTAHRAAHPDHPFFLYLAYDTPHARLQVPTMAYPEGRGVHGGVQWVGTPGAMINTARGSIDAWIHPDYAAATWDHDGNPATAAQPWPAHAQRHATMVRRLDDAIADVLQSLADLQCDTNTFVVFTSDNGAHNEAGSGGAHTYNPTFFDSFGPFDGIKRDCWEGGIRVPTLVRCPSLVPAGLVSSHPSAFWDWMPTFAELARVPPPARTDGVSILPSLTGQASQRPSTLYLEYKVSGSTPAYPEFEPARRSRTRGQMQVIHLEGYKGVRYNITSATTPFEIYNVLHDPKEQTNLASGPLGATLQTAMQDRVLQLRRPLGSSPRPYDDALIPPAPGVSSQPRLAFQLFQGDFPWVPDFATLNPVSAGTCPGLDPELLAHPQADAVLYAGFVEAPADGRYTFYLSAEGRAFLRLHDASLIDADFGYLSGTERSASASLKAGLHPFRLGYVRGEVPKPRLTLHWSGPDTNGRAGGPPRPAATQRVTADGPR